MADKNGLILDAGFLRKLYKAGGVDALNTLLIYPAELILPNIVAAELDVAGDLLNVTPDMEAVSLWIVNNGNRFTHANVDLKVASNAVQPGQPVPRVGFGEDAGDIAIKYLMRFDHDIAAYDNIVVAPGDRPFWLEIKEYGKKYPELTHLRGSYQGVQAYLNDALLGEAITASEYRAMRDAIIESGELQKNPIGLSKKDNYIFFDDDQVDKIDKNRINRNLPALSDGTRFDGTDGSGGYNDFSFEAREAMRTGYALLKQAGVIGDVLGLAYVIYAAEDARQKQGPEVAQQIYGEFLGEITGGVAAGSAAAFVVGGILAASGVGGIPAVVITIGAAFLGASAGGYYAGRWANTAVKEIQARLADGEAVTAEDIVALFDEFTGESLKTQLLVNRTLENQFRYTIIFCFTSDTPISMADGSSKPIEEIEIGDEVTAFEGLSELTRSRVTRLFRNTTRSLYYLSTDVYVTPGHHFLTPSGSFEPISSILEGDGKIVLADGSTQCISAELLFFEQRDSLSDKHRARLQASETAAGWKTYNFEVEKLHTYVAAGMRVHNLSLLEYVPDGTDVKSYTIDDDGEHHLVYESADGRSIKSLRGVPEANPAPGTKPDTVLLELTTYFTSNGASVTHRWSNFENYYDENDDRIPSMFYPDGSPIVDTDDATIDIKFPNALISGEQVGEIFGSQLGRLLAGENQFVQTISGLVIGEVLGEVGEGIHVFLNNVDAWQELLPGEHISVTRAFEAAFDDLGIDLAIGGARAASSFLAAEFINALGIEGIAGELLNSAGGAVLGQIAENIITPNVDWNANLGGSAVNAVAGFIGSKLGHEVINVDSVEGQIGAQIGGSLGGIVGGSIAVSISTAASAAALSTATASAAIAAGYGVFAAPAAYSVGQLATASAWAGPIGIAIGTFIGVVVGGLLGNSLGGPQRAGAMFILDPDNDKFRTAAVWGKNGGDADGAKTIADVVTTSMNAVLDAVGGEVVGGEYLHGNNTPLNGQIDIKNGQLRYRTWDKPSGGLSEKKEFDSVGDFTEYSIFQMLKDMEIAGGNLYAKRALYNTLDDVLNESGSDLVVEDAVEVLMGNLALSVDYESYIEQRELVDLLIVTNPDSAFAGGWYLTLIRAEELGLNKRHWSDHMGGWNYLLKSNEFSAYGDSIFGIQQVDARAADVDFEFNFVTKERLIDVTRANGQVETLNDYVVGSEKIEVQLVGSLEESSDLSLESGFEPPEILRELEAIVAFALDRNAGDNEAYVDLLKSVYGDNFDPLDSEWDLLLDRIDLDGWFSDFAVELNEEIDSELNQDISGSLSTALNALKVEIGDLETAVSLGTDTALNAALGEIEPILHSVTQHVDYAFERERVYSTYNVFNSSQLNTVLDRVTAALVLSGTDNADVIDRTMLGDVTDLGNDIFGEGGNDYIEGGANADWLFGGAGHDTLKAGGGNNNLLDGGAGNDLLIGSNGAGTIEAKRGSDWLIGGAGRDTLIGGRGEDILEGGKGNSDAMKGGAHADTYIFNRGDGQGNWIVEARSENEDTVDYDVLEFGAGVEISDIQIARLNNPYEILNDDGILESQTGRHLVIKIIDSVEGGNNHDVLTIANWYDVHQRIEILRFADGTEIEIGNFASFIIGSEGDDELIGTNFNDFIHGGDGNDDIFAQGGDDVAIGGRGNDAVRGEAGADLVVGADGDDLLSGGGGRDVLSGDKGNDILRGDTGDDVLAGGLDNDVIITGDGDDTILFGFGDGQDIIFDKYNGAPTLIYEDLDASDDYVDPSDSAIPQGYANAPTFGGGYTDLNQIFDGVATQDYALKDGFYIEREVNENGPGEEDDEYITRVYEFDTSGANNSDGGVADQDRIEFKFGVTLENIRILEGGTLGGGGDLVIGLDTAFGTTRGNDEIADTLRFVDWFEGSANGGTSIELFDFVGQTPWDEDGITWVGGIQEWVAGTDGDDALLQGSGSYDWITGGAGNDSLQGGGQIDVLNGGAGNDTLMGNGAGAIGDLLIGGDGFDIADYAGSAAIHVDLTDSNNNTGGDAEGDILRTIEGVHATAFDDTIIGDNHDNELFGREGDDSLVGGTGDDDYIYNLGDGHDIIAERGNSSGDASTAALDAAMGLSDSIYLGEGIGVNDVSFQQANTDDLKILINGNSTDSILIKNWFGPDADKVEYLIFKNGFSIHLQSLHNLNIWSPLTASELRDWLNGSAASDTIDGLGGADIIAAGGGNDSVLGGAGDDTLQGGLGADTLDGGDDWDTALFDGTPDTVNGGVNGVNVNLSDATIVGSGGDAEGDTFISIENIIGSAGDDTLTGSATNNTLVGGQGDDILDGFGSANELFGGGGDDSLYGAESQDTLYGGEGADSIEGAEAKDFIHGGAGNDTIHGQDDDDELYGEGGADLITGGSGHDKIDGNSGDDTITGGLGNDTLFGSGGDDSLTGGDGNDHLYAGAGDDKLIGGAGSDVYLVGRDHGAIEITETAEVNALDRLIFTDGILPSNLWFSYDPANPGDLVIEVIGSDTKVTFKDWQDTEKRLRAIEVSGFAMYDVEVDAWVALLDSYAAEKPTATDEAWPEDLLPELDNFWYPSGKTPPVTNDIDLGGTDEDSVITGQVTATDIDDNIVSYSIKDGHQATYGRVIVNPASGFFIFLPNAKAQGLNEGVEAADSFIVTVTDADGNEAESEVSLSVMGVADAPLAADLVVYTLEDMLTDPSIVDFEDVDINDTLTYQLEGLFDSAGNPLTAQSGVAGEYRTEHGTLYWNADGSFIYAPGTNYSGLDFFTVRATDSTGQQDTSLVAVRVLSDNDYPMGVGLEYDTGLAQEGFIDAFDDETVALSYTILSGPNNGQIQNGVIDQTDGRYIYVPDIGFTGEDSFVVEVSDGQLTQQVTVTVNVSAADPNNTAPVFSEPNTYSINEDQDVTFTLAATDVDGDALVYMLDDPLIDYKGTVEDLGGGQFRFAPLVNDDQSQTLFFRVTDSNGGYDQAPVQINVTPVNDAPQRLELLDQETRTNLVTADFDEDTYGADVAIVAVADPDDTSFTIEIFDANGDNFSNDFEIVARDYNWAGTPVSEYVLKLKDGSIFDYEGFANIDPNSDGKVSLRLKATDAAGDFIERDFDLDLSNLDETPEIVVANLMSDATVDENSTLHIEVTGFNDPDGDALTYEFVDGNGDVIDLSHLLEIVQNQGETPYVRFAGDGTLNFEDLPAEFADTDSFSFNIRARDPYDDAGQAETGSLVSAPQTVTITVADVDELATGIRFTTPMRVDEMANSSGTTFGQVVGQVVVDDPDAFDQDGNSHAFAWTNGIGSNYFDIDPVTGVITVKDVNNGAPTLDFETRNLYDFGIEVIEVEDDISQAAHANGSVSFDYNVGDSSTHHLAVRIDDVVEAPVLLDNQDINVNEHSRLEDWPFGYNIAGDADAGSTIIKTILADPTQTQETPDQFRIIAGQGLDPIFSIDNGGNIRIIDEKALDYENSWYGAITQLTIQARKDDGAWSDPIYVDVSVNDLDEREFISDLEVVSHPTLGLTVDEIHPDYEFDYSGPMGSAPGTYWITHDSNPNVSVWWRWIIPGAPHNLEAGYEVDPYNGNLYRPTTPAALTYVDYAASTFTSGADTFSGQWWAETIYGEGGNDNLSGNNGNDIILGGTGVDTISGGNGNDTLEGWHGNDSILGGAGNDEIRGDAGHDALFGNGGADKILGWTGNDTMDGGSGADTIKGGNGADSVLGQTGADRLYGESGNDTLLGGGDADILDGGADNDSLSGGDGADVLEGGVGQDTLIGDAGADTLRGGAGDDLYVVGSGADTILDEWLYDSITYDAGQSDVVRLSGTGLAIQDLQFDRVGDDLQIRIASDNTLLATLQNQFEQSGKNVIEFIQIDTGALELISGLAVADTPPSMTAATFSLDENLAAHSLATLVATNAYGNSDDITFSISAGNEESLFSINASTGELSTTGPLDHEQAASHDLTISMTDEMGRVGIATVTVDVNDVDEAVILDDQVFDIDETPFGLFIPLVFDLVDEGATPVWSITGGNEAGLFNITLGGSLVVSAAEGLDYETAGQHVLTVHVADSDDPGSLYDTAVITINVNDLQEAPNIDGFLTDIDEGSLDTSLGFIIFSDDDDNNNANISLQIIEGNDGGWFVLDGATGEIRTSAVNALDFESSQLHNIVIEATDITGLTSQGTVLVNVKDVVEAPDAPDQGILIDEMMTPGVIGAVNYAPGDHSQHFWTIVSGNEDGLFEIDNAGQISLAEGMSLDHEADSTHILMIEVADTHDGTGLGDTATYTINVNNINEAPEISINDTNIDENLLDAEVAVISVTDVDIGDSHTFAFIAGNDDGLFVIDSINGTIKTSDTLAVDFEAASTHVLTVQVTDVGGLSNQTDVTITVNDVDEAPEVDDQSLSIDENLGGVVGSVAFNPHDLVQHYWSITAGNANGWFEVDNYGQINLVAPHVLDYETASSHVLTVQVDDTSDGTGLSDTAQVIINVNDVNEAPTLTGFDVTVAENQLGASLGFVSVADVDANDTHTYAITAGNEDGFFTVDINTGEVAVSSIAAPNFELDSSSYSLTVEVTDGAGLKATAIVNITISDANDAPVLDPYSASIDENAIGALGSVTATDEDAGQQAGLVYAITAGNADGAFSIHSVTGVLSLDTALDHEAAATRDLTIEVTDTGGLSDTAVASIAINNLFDEVPVATQTSFTFTTPEDSQTLPSFLGGGEVANDLDDNMVLGTITGVTDADVGDTLSYTIVSGETYSGTDIFDINANGQLIAKNTHLFNHEAVQSFNLTVRATDLGGNQSANINVTVNLTDLVDDKTDQPGPTFGPSSYTFWISEDSEIMLHGSPHAGSELPNDTDWWSSLGTVTATDSSPDGVVDYRITSGNTVNGTAVYDIDSSGNIYVINPDLLDYENAAARNLALQVQAQDKWGRWGETVTVNAGIWDRPDHAVNVYTATVNSATVGSGYTRHATGWNGGWMYYITQNSTGNTIVEDGIHNGQTFVNVYYTNTYKTVGWGGSNAGYMVYYNTPVVLDLGGDGIDLVSLQSSDIHFDVDGDGQLERTGWAGADDGILALDRNGDGVIGDGSEISFVQDLEGATTDMEGLVAFDSNGDGQLSALDEAYDEFLVWQDRNQDGISQADELTSLADAGIAAISLDLESTGQSTEGATDNVVFNMAWYETADGTRNDVADTAFAYEDQASGSIADEEVAKLIQAMASFGGASGLDLDLKDKTFGHDESSHSPLAVQPYV